MTIPPQTSQKNVPVSARGKSLNIKKNSSFEYSEASSVSDESGDDAGEESSDDLKQYVLY